MLPRERGRGWYCGASGMGGGVGSARVGAGVGGAPRPCEGGRIGSAFLILWRYGAGIEETGATVGRFVLSAAATGRGPNFGFGLRKSKRSSS